MPDLRLIKDGEETANPRMIRLARNSRGMDQSELAKKTGLSLALIVKAEKGQVEVAAEWTAAIASALGYPAALLMREYESVTVACPRTAALFREAVEDD